MSEVYEKLMRCLESVRKHTDFCPEVALVLGSGLGDYADSIQVEAEISYSEIGEFPFPLCRGMTEDLFSGM